MRGWPVGWACGVDQADAGALDQGEHAEALLQDLDEARAAGHCWVDVDV